MGDIATEIIVANAVHYKVRDYVNTEILNSMYHAQFESWILYACIIWEQNVCFPKESVKIDSFLIAQCPYYPLFFKSKIMKLPDKIRIKNCVLEFRIKNYKYTNNKLPSIFNKWFIFFSNFHKCGT